MLSSLISYLDTEATPYTLEGLPPTLTQAATAVEQPAPAPPHEPSAQADDEWVTVDSVGNQRLQQTMVQPVEAPQPAPIGSTSAAEVNWSDALWDTFAPFSESLEKTVEKLQAYTLEYNHPWKQQRYALALDQIRRSLEGHGNSIAETIQTLECLQGTTEPPPPLATATLDALRALQHTKRGSEDPRHQHVLWIESMRVAITQPAYSEQLQLKKEGSDYDPGLDILLRCCEASYSDVHMYPFFAELVEIVIRAGETELQATSSTFEQPDVSEAEFLSINAIPKEMGANRLGVDIRKLRGTLNIGFDPRLQSNLPSVSYDVSIATAKGTKPVRCLRMGSPTQENTLSPEAEIIPTFRSFLQSRQAQAKKHLYISLQRNWYTAISNEKARTDAISSLQQEFSDSFFLAILDQDSSFYRQSQEHSETSSATAFKENFVFQMTSPDENGFYFPPAWLGEARFTALLQSSVEFIHQAVFGGTPNLTVQERLDFIELAYAVIELNLVQYSDADTFNLTCKDGIDRAGKSNALLFRMLLILGGQDQNPLQRRRAKVLTHAPAFTVKKQAIVSSRRARLLPVLARLEDATLGDKIRELAPHFGLSNVGIPVMKLPAGQTLVG